jgi:hypothetical protein
MIDGSSAVALRFTILGPVRAYRDTEPVDLGPPNQQAALAVLLLHAREPVPAHRIVAALWNGDPPENGVDVVQRFVGALRRALDPQRTSLLALTPGGYVLRADESATDAGLFRAALTRARTAHQTGDLGAVTGEVCRALDLWKDEPLAGLTGPVFESARARLNAERATAAELLANSTRAALLPAKPSYPGPPTLGPSHPGLPDPGASLVRPSLTGHPLTAPSDPGPSYPEPVDPWAGHELFPPGPF